VVEDLVGEIEPYPLRLAAGIVACLTLFALIGVGRGLAIAAFAWTLRLCGISVE
jgi:hypothetical protein